MKPGLYLILKLLFKLFHSHNIQLCSYVYRQNVWFLCNFSDNMNDQTKKNLNGMETFVEGLLRSFCHDDLKKE